MTKLQHNMHQENLRFTVPKQARLAEAARIEHMVPSAKERRVPSTHGCYPIEHAYFGARH